jgi:hypothetical protein
MSDLSPPERFNQLLSFLEDPQTHPHPTITINDFVWLEVARKPDPEDYLSWPWGLPLGEFVNLYEREHSTQRVEAYRREALEIMKKSGMFRMGHLRGTRKSPDIAIKNLEAFILQLASVFHNMKHHILRSPFDNKGERLEEVLEGYFKNMIGSFYIWSGSITYYRLVRQVKMEGIKNQLKSIQNKVREKTRDKLSFDPIDESIFIFLIHTEASPNLIARRIHDFFYNRLELLPKNIFLPTKDAIRKRVEKFREGFLKAY